MSAPDWVELAKRHTLFSWSATDAVEPLPIVRAEGVYVYGAGGERWLDFNSQLMCVNVGRLTRDPQPGLRTLLRRPGSVPSLHRPSGRPLRHDGVA